MSKWSHPKYKGKLFQGKYKLIPVENLAKIERIFMLIHTSESAKSKSILKSFESWQAAVKAGWRKL